MYPFIRLVWQFAKHRNDPPLPVTGTHISQHYCLPWDLDVFMELNNGRTLTLLDMGRLPLAKRTGLLRALSQNKWGLTMAGVTVRYRRRVKAFDRVTIKSRALCWDDRFFYLEQAMFRADGECANHAIYRAAITSKSGMISPATVLASIGYNTPSPPVPDWISIWIASETARPWPPMTDALP